MSNNISCKEFYGLNGSDDLREKLILDYEKLYYRLKRRFYKLIFKTRNDYKK